MFDAYAVIGTHDEIAEKLRARRGGLATTSNQMTSPRPARWTRYTRSSPS